MSLQGVVLGLMPLLMEHEVDWRVGLVALATVMGKGMLIPGLLRRAMRAANIDREVEPFIGFVPSLLLGAGGTIARRGAGAGAAAAAGTRWIAAGAGVAWPRC